MNSFGKELEAAVSFCTLPFSPEKVMKISPAIRMILKKKKGSIVIFCTNDLVHYYSQNEPLFLSLFDEYANKFIVPFYYGKQADAEFYGSLRKASSDQPGINLVCLQGLGVFAWGETRRTSEMCMNFFLSLVKVNQYRQTNPSFSSAEAQAYLATTYGTLFFGQTGDGGPLAEKIAVITGAAQGLGEGIAAGLAGDGAYVVLADINGNAVAANARALNEQYGPGKALAVRTDVADESQVKQLVEATVTHYGGLDIFISNAGILKAGSLEDMTPADFTLSMQVNYVAFFLCARYASIPMKIQAEFAPGYFMDIIQVNSKSGLAGSRKNFAYAGSKFGGIGLTESFALELAEYNIKVNAVCPGNFFEGPLWSHPDTGLFIQYLKAGKVPGAVTVEDVRRFYESQVPMRRGCRISDVVKAILYIIDQEYETGQAVPVTGGQIMLK